MSQFSHSEEHTPLMKQYWDLKSQVKDALLLFRMGDFYELFGDDAVVASGILEITLTSRDKNKTNPIPMAGVPHHSVQGYIQKLLKAGKKIAIGEQVEDPETIKGTGKIVRREIVRILTPGVQFDAEGSEANYLAIVLESNDSKYKGLFVLACLDASTGEALVSEPLPLSEIANEIRALPVRHLLHLEPGLDFTNASLSPSLLLETLPGNYLSLEKAAATLKRHYDLENLQTFITTQTGIFALGTLVSYVLRTQLQEKLAHLKLPEPLQKPKSMVLGPNTSQHLDLDDLFVLINKTRCTLGARQLKRWLLAPLKSPDSISARQKAVQQLSLHWRDVSEKLIRPLSQVYDLERISGRINTRLANPKDTLALGQSLSHLADLRLPPAEGMVSDLLSTLFQQAKKLHNILSPLSEKIIRNQREDAPITSRDGGIFKRGTTPDLDHLISLTENGQRWLIDLENREREKTGIPSLKVRYNRVFGYYIEITQAHLKHVPPHYQRKQTMVGAERFFTDELKNFEEEILTASTRMKSLEQELFQQLLDEIQEKTSSIMEAAQVFGEIDALLALAVLSKEPGWNFPQIDDSLDLDIQAGRHPTVDQSLRGGFVPNNTSLSPTTRLTLLITGPNMGGKSTVMRQVALIAILGQMGAPIPAASARWGAFSSVYTRIGAHDAISRGQSTFMVEMSELAQILHRADDRALIILDEIGRGTSTYDGISVAWATLEWICTEVKARTLFATHYHELIRLSTTLPLLANAHMAVDQNQTKQNKTKTLRFLYELREGPTNESFGIHVAQLAGLPKPIIERAWTILEELEQQSNHHAVSSLDQMSLFEAFSNAELRETSLNFSEPEPSAAIHATPPEADSSPSLGTIQRELEALDLNEITPLQALNLLAKMKQDATL